MATDSNVPKAPNHAALHRLQDYNRGMPVVKISLLPVLCVIVGAAALAQTAPEFPQLELKRGHEGWVVLEFSIDETGQVADPSISDSSVSDAFNEAVLAAASDWTFDAGNERQSSALVNFVFEEKRPRLTKKFAGRYAKVHRAIDRGDLSTAEDRLAEIREDKKLNASELAYSYLAEGRIAGERGDKSAHLACFRKAILNHGHWVTDETYMRLLYATTILGLQQQDIASAVRDYELLVELESGRAIASNIDGTIRAAKQFLAENDINASPYMATNYVVDVEEEAPRDLEDYDVYTGADAGWAMSSDEADTPDANN